jgi:hypothetical protein
MEGGVKYHPSVLKVKKTHKNKKVAGPLVRKSVPGVITIKRKKLNLKKTVEDLISIDRDPNDFLPMAIKLIKQLLRIIKAEKSSIADKKKIDNFVLTLVNSLYYGLRKENNINRNSNATNNENMNEDNIWNDPYTLLRTLVGKLELLLGTDDEEFKLEISETIKEALKYGYNKVYVEKKDVVVDELADLFSGARL